MKFKFKIQSYQTEAVENTTAIFTGQPNRDAAKYRRDLGKIAAGTIREMRDASAANDNVLDNFEQIFRHYSPDTIRKVM